MAKNVIGLAKNSTKKTVSTKVVSKPVEKKLTPEEERDLKAKETVEKLLEDSPIITLDKKEEVIEIETTPEPPKGVEWLEEQITLLSEKNEALLAELALARADNQQYGNSSVVNNDEVKLKVYELFDELQTNHLRMGTDPQTGVGNFRIFTPGFLHRMITFFPFLEEAKRF